MDDAAARDAFLEEKMDQRPQTPATRGAEEQLSAKVTELHAKVTELTEEMGACNAKGVELTADVKKYRIFWEAANREAEKLQAGEEVNLQRCKTSLKKEKKGRITAELLDEDCKEKLRITEEMLDEDCKEKLRIANTQGSGGGRKKRKSRRRKKTRKSKKRKSTKRRSKKSKRR